MVSPRTSTRTIKSNGIVSRLFGRLATTGGGNVERAASVHIWGIRAMKDYAIISKHEKGFWQIDVYWQREWPLEEGDVPDHFKTCKTGEPIETAIEWAKQWCMHAERHVLEDEDEDETET
jgi:hypothetical protein